MRCEPRRVPRNRDVELNQVTLPCTDYEASAAFYRRLGLKQIVASPPRYARLECPGGATFSIHHADPARPSKAVVYFEVHDVDAVVADLKAAGVAFETEPRSEAWLWREARLRDPAGNPLCIYHAGVNRRAPPWRIGESVEALLLDLGNVVVPIDFARMFAAWGESAGVPAEALRERVTFDAAYCAHERGEIDTPTYFAHLRSRLGIALSDEALLTGWNAIFLEPEPAMAAVLEELAVRYPLYLFSNTNPAHAAHWSRRYAGLLARFKGIFTSFGIGERKPAALAFRRVAERIGLAPGRIAFFDDGGDNVAGANRAGLQGFLAAGPDDIRGALSTSTPRNATVTLPAYPPGGGTP